MVLRHRVGHTIALEPLLHGRTNALLDLLQRRSCAASDVSGQEEEGGPVEDVRWNVISKEGCRSRLSGSAVSISTAHHGGGVAAVEGVGVHLDLAGALAGTL